MKTVKINNFSEELYFDTLDNGMKIYLVPLNNKTSYFISLGVKYGNSYTNFKVNKKEYTVPSGVAHFLEHKLFEKEDMSKPFDFFGSSGTDVNAGTSVLYTNYYCTGSNNFNNNLEYMLNWLKDISITDEKVTKEKEIIIQEARMHDDDPDRFINEKVKENTFIKDPYGYKVIGTEESIKNINKEDLNIAFKSFYRPDNMFLIITGKFDIENTIKIINAELKDYKNPKTKVSKIKVDEPKEVKIPYEEYSRNIASEKVAINYKIDKKILNLEDFKLENYVSMVLNIVFGRTSIFLEQGLKSDLFYDLSSFVTSSDDYGIISFDSTCKDSKLLIEKIDNTLKNFTISEEDFNRVKKSWIASEIKSVDNVGLIANDIFSDIIYYDNYKYNRIKDLEELSYNELQDVIKKLYYYNKAVVVLKPNK